MFGIPLEVISMGFSTVLGAVLKLIAQGQEDRAKEREYLLSKYKTVQESVKEARGLTGGALWTRRFIVISMIGFVGFILLAPVMGLQTNVPIEVIEEEGLFIWTDTTTTIKWEQLNGMVTPEWLKYAILDIIGFYFGTSSVARK